MIARLTGALLALILWSAPAPPGPPRDDFWAVPDGAVAWWVFDPSLLGQGAATDPARALAAVGHRLAPPGGRKEPAASRPKGPPWAEVSWCPTPRSFIIGFGQGAIERWLSATEFAAGAEPALARAQIAQRRPGSALMLE